MLFPSFASPCKAPAPYHPWISVSTLRSLIPVGSAPVRQSMHVFPFCSRRRCRMRIRRIHHECRVEPKRPTGLVNRVIHLMWLVRDTNEILQVGCVSDQLGIGRFRRQSDCHCERRECERDNGFSWHGRNNFETGNEVIIAGRTYDTANVIAGVMGAYHLLGIHRVSANWNPGSSKWVHKFSWWTH